MLESFDLSDQFFGVTSDFGGENFHRSNHKVRVDDESSADVHAGFFVIDSVCCPDFAAGIRQQRERHSARHHLGQFFFLPDSMHKATVCAHRQNDRVELLELIIKGGDRRQFGRSDKCEIAWIEAQDDPLAFVV